MGNRYLGRGGGDHAELVRVKLVIFALGAAFGVGGMASGLRLFTWIGIAILFAGVLLRFLPYFRDRSNSHSAAQGEETPLEDDTPARDGSGDTRTGNT